MSVSDSDTTCDHDFHPNGHPPYKRARIDVSSGKEVQSCCDDSSNLIQYVRRLLQSGASLDSLIPDSLVSDSPTGNSVDRFQNILQKHGFRTSKVVTDSGAGVSLYTMSVRSKVNQSVAPLHQFADGRRFLSVAFGLSPYQKELEEVYDRHFKDRWCVISLCQKMHQFYFGFHLLSELSTEDAAIRSELSETIRAIQWVCREDKSLIDLTGDVATLISKATNVTSRHGKIHRAEEWEREYRRIRTANTTLANVHLTLLQSHTNSRITNVILKPGEPRFERITICLCDSSNCPYLGPAAPFSFLPCLETVINHGVEATVSKMVESLFDNMLRLGYYTTQKIKDLMRGPVHQYFLCGWIQRVSISTTNSPLSLRAGFDPSFPLSIYLHGLPGSGKSSFARYLPMAMQRTLNEYADFECFVQHVKQNLNKPMKTLELELEIRPNNNDMSLMTIIQSRKQKLSQNKRGLVVMDLEEMPCFDGNGDPNQKDVVRLLAHRFEGRKADFRQKEGPSAIVAGLGSSNSTKQAAQNSTRKGIASDFSLMTVFTSNYPLSSESLSTLMELDIFRELVVVEMRSISGEERTEFAKAYFLKVFQEFRAAHGRIIPQKLSLNLDIDLGTDDTRPLVTTLRLLSYYLSEMMSEFDSVNDASMNKLSSINRVRIQESLQQCSISLLTGKKTVKRQLLERHTNCSSYWIPIAAAGSTRILDHVYKFWKARILAPVVILCKSKNQAEKMMVSLEQDKDCHCIHNVNAETYKMTRSLYDRKDEPNLRDDILRIGQGMLVAIELICPSWSSQLLVREMIEDSPSMTAFSSTKSALFKDGLLFVLVVEGLVSPEIISRVSFTIDDT